MTRRFLPLCALLIVLLCMAVSLAEGRRGGGRPIIGGGSGGAPPRCSPDQENMPLAVDSLQFEHAGSTSSAAALLRGSLLWLALYCFLWDAFL